MRECIELRIEQANAYSEIKPKLHGNIFHVTSLQNLDAILRSEEIRPNYSGELKGAFGDHINSFARTRNRVSLFDFHNPTASQIEEHVGKCLPTLGFSSNNPLAFLFLSEKYWPNVVPYSEAEFEANMAQIVVPYVEATYSGTIPLDAISKIIKVSFNEDPLFTIMKAAQQRYCKANQ